jgi:hypothetical protein
MAYSSNYCPVRPGYLNISIIVLPSPADFMIDEKFKNNTEKIK